MTKILKVTALCGFLLSMEALFRIVLYFVGDISFWILFFVILAQFAWLSVMEFRKTDRAGFCWFVLHMNCLYFLFLGAMPFPPAMSQVILGWMLCLICFLLLSYEKRLTVLKLGQVMCVLLISFFCFFYAWYTDMSQPNPWYKGAYTEVYEWDVVMPDISRFVRVYKNSQRNNPEETALWRSGADILQRIYIFLPNDIYLPDTFNRLLLDLEPETVSVIVEDGEWFLRLDTGKLLNHYAGIPEPVWVSKNPKKTEERRKAWAEDLAEVLKFKDFTAYSLPVCDDRYLYTGEESVCYIRICKN